MAVAEHNRCVKNDLFYGLELCVWKALAQTSSVHKKQARMLEETCTFRLHDQPLHKKFWKQLDLGRYGSWHGLSVSRCQEVYQNHSSEVSEHCGWLRLVGASVLPCRAGTAHRATFRTCMWIPMVQIEFSLLIKHVHSIFSVLKEFV